MQYLMAEKDQQRGAHERAIERRKELSDSIRKELQEIETIDTFLKAYRKYSGIEPQGGVEPEGVDPPSLGRAGLGMTQALFEYLAREILCNRGEPMQSQEFVEAFRDRGQPIGGTNELKQAWNRLWQAKVNGVLVHFPKPGYWLADEPVPESRSVRNKAAIENGLMEKPEPHGPGHKYLGKRMGRPKVITDGQIETAQKWLLEGNKSLKQISIDLGGVNLQTLRNHLSHFLKELREKRTAEKVERDLLS